MHKYTSTHSISSTTATSTMEFTSTHILNLFKNKIECFKTRKTPSLLKRYSDFMAKPGLSDADFDALVDLIIDDYSYNAESNVSCEEAIVDPLTKHRRNLHKTI